MPSRCVERCGQRQARGARHVSQVPSRTAAVPVPADLHSVAVLKPLFLAPRPQPLRGSVHRFDGAALGHHPHVFAAGPTLIREIEQFRIVVRRVDDKFELKIDAAIDQRPHRRDGHPSPQMKVVPTGMLYPVGGTGTKLGTDRQQVTVDVAIDRAGSFDRDVLVRRAKQAAQMRHFPRQQRFASGQNNMGLTRSHDLVDDRFDRHGFAGWIPRGIGSVAEPTSQVAAAGADEEAVRTGQLSLALPAGERFGNTDRPPGRRLRPVRYLRAT